MARYGQQKISKRAAHKLAVASRKDLPFIKLRKKSRKDQPFPSDFFAAAREQEREGVLLTRSSSKPPAFRAETTDDQGNPIVVMLRAAAKGLRGWDVLLPNGQGMFFATRRKACKCAVPIVRLRAYAHIYPCATMTDVCAVDDYGFPVLDPDWKLPTFRTGRAGKVLSGNPRFGSELATSPIEEDCTHPYKAIGRGIDLILDARGHHARAAGIAETIWNLGGRDAAKALRRHGLNGLIMEDGDLVLLQELMTADQFSIDPSVCRPFPRHIVADRVARSRLYEYRHALGFSCWREADRGGDCRTLVPTGGTIENVACVRTAEQYDALVAAVAKRGVEHPILIVQQLARTQDVNGAILDFVDEETRDCFVLFRPETLGTVQYRTDDDDA